MSNQKSHTTPEGLPPSQEEEFYLSWGRETLKQNFVLVNDILRQLVTINIALLGGSTIFLNDSLINRNFKIGIILLLMVSLFISFLGVIPYTANVDIKNPAKIKNHKEKALWRKLFFLKISGGLIILAIITALVGLMTHTQ